MGLESPASDLFAQTDDGHGAVSLEAALSTIQRDGEIPWMVRNRLRQWVERQSESWPAIELLAAERVLPIWTARHAPGRPAELIESARAVLQQVGDQQSLERAADEFQLVLDELIYQANGDVRQLVPVYAGFAAWAAAAAVLSPSRRDMATELESDPLDWTASFHGSLAEAGGATWEGSIGDAGRRRAYWTWWLTEALLSVAPTRPHVTLPDAAEVDDVAAD